MVPRNSTRYSCITLVRITHPLYVLQSQRRLRRPRYVYLFGRCCFINNVAGGSTGLATTTALTHRRAYAALLLCVVAVVAVCCVSCVPGILCILVVQQHSTSVLLLVVVLVSVAAHQAVSHSPNHVLRVRVRAICG